MLEEMFNGNNMVYLMQRRVCENGESGILGSAEATRRVTRTVSSVLTV